jgi:hypothetical protein
MEEARGFMLVNRTMVKNLKILILKMTMKLVAKVEIGVNYVIIAYEPKKGDAFLVVLCNKPLYKCMETFSDGCRNTWYEGDMRLGGMWYKRIIGPSSQNPSYMLLKDATPIVTYSPLVIKSKFLMFHNVTRKGNLRFTMPLHVRENNLNIIEEKQSYCPNSCTKIPNCEMEINIGFKKSCVM